MTILVVKSLTLSKGQILLVLFDTVLAGLRCKDGGMIGQRRPNASSRLEVVVLRIGLNVKLSSKVTIG